MIPLIDAAALFGQASPARDACDAAIAAAAANSGFLGLAGLPDRGLLSPARRELLLQIFDLPDGEKAKLLRRSFDPARPNIYRGWYPLQDGVPSYKEGIDMGPDLVHGRAVVNNSDPLREATPLPPETLLPGWHRAAAETYQALQQVGQALMRSIARGLALPECSFDAAFEGGISTLRLTRFPPRTAASLVACGQETLTDMHRGERRMLINVAHADSGFVTLLVQNGTPGLQARTRDGHWIDVPATEGTLAVNFGKLLERWSGGRIRATEHRVLGGEEERFSMPFFYEPRADAVIAPLPLQDVQPFAPFYYGDHLWEATTQFVEQRGIASLRKPLGPAPSREGAVA